MMDDITPDVVMAICVAHIICVDGHIAHSEVVSALVRCFPEKWQHERAIAVIGAAGTLDLSAIIAMGNAIMDYNQKLCLLTNLIDLMLVDGHEDPSELALLRVFAKGFGIPTDQADMALNVLRVMHNRRCMYAWTG